MHLGRKHSVTWHWMAILPPFSWEPRVFSQIFVCKFSISRWDALQNSTDSVCFVKSRISAVKADHDWTSSTTFLRREWRVSIPDVIMYSNLVMLDKVDEFCDATTDSCWDVSWTVSWIVEDWSRISRSFGPISWTSTSYSWDAWCWLLPEIILSLSSSKLREKVSRCCVCLSIAWRICTECCSVELWCAVTLSLTVLLLATWYFKWQSCCNEVLTSFESSKACW